MSQNFSVIDGISVTSTAVRCPGCGATIGVKFEPATATLHCPFCGLSSNLPAPEDGEAPQELDFNSALQRANVNWGSIKKLVVCSNCGGQALYDAEQISGACPLCGSTSVAPAAENEQIMAPNAIIPFSVSREQALQCFTDYMHKKQLVSKEVYNSKLENLVGIYLPFWTYDAYTVSTYSAKKDTGNEEGPIGYYKGVWNQAIDDVIIFASDRIHHRYLPKVSQFDFNQAVPYSPEYLAGIPAERYTVGLNAGWVQTMKQVEPKLRNAIEDNYKDLWVTKMTTKYYNVKFRYVLAPVYFASFTVGKYTYPVVINGQTGKTFFDVPTYLTKMIIFFVSLGLLSLAIYFIVILLLQNQPWL